MPVHKVGYRPWEGKKSALWNRWWIITETGFQIAFKSSWVKRILLISWLPILYWGLAVFMIEQTLVENIDKISENESVRQELAEVFVEWVEDDLDVLPQTDALKQSLQATEKQDLRHGIWSWLLMTFFRYPQGTAMLFLLGIVVPGMISRDIRSRAFLIYFSRPIGRVEYIIGKFMVPASFLMLITTIPAICLYVFGVMLSPSINVTFATWDLPFRIIAASICLILPTVSIALMLSSVTQESRFATFAWFTVWALGHAAWSAIVIARAIQLNQPPFSDDLMNDLVVQRWSVMSLYNNLSSVQSWIFGFESFAQVWPSILVLVLVTFASFVLLYRGVSAPTNI